MIVPMLLSFDAEDGFELASFRLILADFENDEANGLRVPDRKSH